MGTDTLVEDIYSLLSTKETSDEIDIEKNIELFGESVKELMRNQFLVSPNKLLIVASFSITYLQVFYFSYPTFRYCDGSST